MMLEDDTYWLHVLLPEEIIFFITFTAMNKISEHKKKFYLFEFDFLTDFKHPILIFYVLFMFIMFILCFNYFFMCNALLNIYNMIS